MPCLEQEGEDFFQKEEDQLSSVRLLGGGSVGRAPILIPVSVAARLPSPSPQHPGCASRCKFRKRSFSSVYSGASFRLRRGFSQVIGLTLWQGMVLALCVGDRNVQSSALASKLPRADALLVQRGGKKQHSLGALLRVSLALAGKKEPDFRGTRGPLLSKQLLTLNESSCSSVILSLGRQQCEGKQSHVSWRNMRAARTEELEKCRSLVRSQVKDGVAWTCWIGCSAT